MTTGSFNRDSYTTTPQGKWVGLKWRKSWTGADYPNQPGWVTVPKSTITRYGEWYDRKGRRLASPWFTFTIPQHRVGVSRPPVRPHDNWHTYSMTTFMGTDEYVDYVESGFPQHQAVLGRFGSQQTDPVPLFTGNEQNAIITKLNEKITGSDFNLGIFLAEGNETIQLIANSAVRIAKSLHHLRRGDLTGAIRSLVEGTSRAPLRRYRQDLNLGWVKPTARNLSSHWLEFQYGWLPLLKDTEEAAHFIAHKVSVPFSTHIRAGKRLEKLTIRKPIFPITGQITVPLYAEQVRTIHAFLIEEPGIMAQLGLDDPFSIAWEKVPFSFVADWFIPIGSFLEARGASSRLKGLFWTSDKSFGYEGPVSGGTIFGPTRARWSYATSSRASSTTLQVERPAFKPLSKVFSWQHTANAVALLTRFATGNPAPRKPR